MGTTTSTTTDYGAIHATCGQPHRPFTPCPLTPDQLDGLACIECEGTDGAMRPVGVVDGAQVFAHPGCSPADAVAHAATMPPQERYEAGPEGYVLDCGHVAEVDGPCGPTTGRAWCVECGESAVVVERT